MPLKIKSQKVYAAYLSLAGINAGELEEKVFMESAIFYNEAGKIISSSKYLPTGEMESSLEIKYDENNNIIEEVHFIRGNEISERKTYRYENDLRVEEQIHYLDGSFDKIIYLYDERKRLMEKRAFDDEDQFEYLVKFHYTGDFLSEMICTDTEENVKEKEIYILDSKGNIVEKTILFEDGTTETVRNQYNDLGNLIRSGRENDPEKTETTYQYDPSGNVIEENLFSGKRLVRKSTFVYDENNLVKEAAESVFIPGLASERQIRKTMEYEFY